MEAARDAHAEALREAEAARREEEIRVEAAERAACLEQDSSAEVRLVQRHHIKRPSMHYMI